MKRTGILSVAAIASLLTAAVVVRASSTTPVLTTIVDFGPGTGQNPTSALFSDPAGDVFGTTAGGGSGNNGTVFELPAGQSSLTTLGQLNANGSQGSIIRGVVSDVSGNLYGVTQSGGANNDGAIFKIAARTGVVSTLFSFGGATNGSSPECTLAIDSAGNLYGTTSAGGPGGDGTVFELSAGTNTLTTLASFSGTDGSTPQAGVVLDSHGNLYGTTSVGGTAGDGEIFKLVPATHSLTTLLNFTGTNGNQPWAALVPDPRGNGLYYGTTTAGGSAGRGNVFSFSTTTDTIINSIAFNGTNGADPMSDPIEDADGNLFGSSVGGGPNDVGAIYEIPANFSAVNSVYAFTLTGSATTGDDPNGGITATPSGNLYGTNYQGGPGERGTLFEITGSGFVVPEPSSLSLVMLGLVPLLRRRRSLDRGKYTFAQDR
jgi:uncharacterized repeat protein (TIGR03803 family)